MVTKLYLLLIVSFLLQSCISEPKSKESAPQVSNQPKMEVYKVESEFPSKEDWYLDNEYTIENIDPVSVAFLDPYLFLSDTLSQIVLQYNTKTKETKKLVENEKVSYINQRSSRVIFPMVDLDSIFVYRGTSDFYRLIIENKLNRPIDFDGFKKKDFAISDAGNHRIIRKIGDEERIIGKKGSAEGEFLNPDGIHFANGNLYVADSGNNRIQSFNNEGEHLSTISGGVLKGVSIISSDKKNLFILDKMSKAIHVYSPKGDLLYSLDEFFVDPSYIFFYRSKLYVADRKGSTVKVLGHKKYDLEMVQYQ